MIGVESVRFRPNGPGREPSPRRGIAVVFRFRGIVQVARNGRMVDTMDEVSMMWSWIVPIITLIVGGVAGFFIGVYYLRMQLERMQNNPEMLQKMAKQMGYNMNKQQMNKVQQMMKNQKFR